MAATDLASSNGHDLSDADARAAAQEMWRQAQAAGEPITGVDLGRAFGKTDRWGRKQIERARSVRTPRATAAGTRPEARPPRNAPSSPAGTPGGEAPRSKPHATGSRPRAGDPGTDPDLISGNGTSIPPVPPAAERVPEHDPTERSARTWPDALVVLVVASVAAAASYGHMLEVALAAGEPLWIARAFPITVDGLVIAALRRGEEGRRWLGLAVFISVATNVLAQFPEHAEVLGPAVSAWPPLALYGTHRLLHRQDPKEPAVPAEGGRSRSAGLPTHGG